MTAKYTGLHSLRHFYASWLINRKEDGGLGLPPTSVQERLGHSTIAELRHIIVHRSATYDTDYLKTVTPYGIAPTGNVGASLELDGEIVDSLLDQAGKQSLALVNAVDEWLVAH